MIGSLLRVCFEPANSVRTVKRKFALEGPSNELSDLLHEGEKGVRVREEGIEKKGMKMTKTKL